MEKLQIQESVGSFQEELKKELSKFLGEQKNKFPENEILKIDMHCHDHNSDVPDELLGRILNVPETWLGTEKLLETLYRNQVDVITITNHNNARSCFEWKKKGVDVLVGAEFSCMVPDFQVGIHVLAYGFDQEQERVLYKLRKDVYKFQRYAFEHEIPTVWAHPLYHYSSKGVPPMDFFNKMSLIFERFEVLNGQRDSWQNLLVKFWLEGLSPEKIDLYSEQFLINPKIYCSNPYKKSFIGGSDSHMGIFAGQTGTYLHVPNLSGRHKTISASRLALEAIKKGNTAVFGNHQNFEKLTIAFLDYVCQIAMFKKDPGLMRILLHKGDTRNKILALVVSNAFSELQQHKVTMRFVELFHNCFIGNKPALSQRMFVPKVYKPVFDDAIKIARSKNLSGEEMVKMINRHINSISNKLSAILYGRIKDKLSGIKEKEGLEIKNFNEFIEQFELPSDIRSLYSGTGQAKNNHGNMVKPDLDLFLDGLSFPFLASTIILGANFTSARVMYNNRELLKAFSTNMGKLKHPERMLWLTDTFEDKNGVSMFLQDAHREIKKRNLPVDLLVCSNHLQPDDHLLVVRPMMEFPLPYYENQTIRIPDFVEIHNLFLENAYDRIVCSTEGIMGVVALYLKNAYSVHTYFYMHTDWIMFARKVLKVDMHNLNRVRRFFRAYYKAFDGVFVLNTDHKKWLTSQEMGLDHKKVFLTAHWVDEKFKPVKASKETVFGLAENEKVLLFSGRLSKEKGIMEIPALYKRLKQLLPGLRVVFAGAGPAGGELRDLMPDAIFLGWVKHDLLPQVYSSADLLILPSRFDTFSCVVLEALSCGLPVIAYKSKGPKDILADQENGYLVSTLNEMEFRIVEYFSGTETQKIFKYKSIERAGLYKPGLILEQFMSNINLFPEFQHEEATT
jgi:glycosyltransferase involved in cell wall biosynthesis